MTPERYKQVKDLFQAVTNLPAGEHEAYLQKECGDDGELRREVDSLLEHHYRNTQLLEDPAPDLRSSKLTHHGMDEPDSPHDEPDPVSSGLQQGRFTPGTPVAGGGHHVLSSCSAKEAWARSTAPTTSPSISPSP